MPIVLTSPYATLAEVKAECELSTTEYDELFSSSINMASRWIDEHCRRDFMWHDHTETALEVFPDWVINNEIFLPWPVRELTQVKLAGRAGGESILDPTLYWVEPNLHSPFGKIARQGRWRNPSLYPGLATSTVHQLPVRIMLTGTFGYTPVENGGDYDLTKPSPQLPATIRHACAVIAAVRSGKYRKMISSPDGAAQAITVKSLPREISEMLSRYVVKNT